jgi:hypothetical protein
VIYAINRLLTTVIWRNINVYTLGRAIFLWYVKIST